MAAPVLTLSTASSPSPSSSNSYIPDSQSQSHPNQHHHREHSQPINALAALSRNASVISSSSSSSSSSSVLPPIRPSRPPRTFSNHSQSTARARSPPSNGYPRSPTTPTRLPAALLPRTLSPDPHILSGPPTPVGSRPPSRGATRPQPVRTRSDSGSAAQKGITADDFEFGDILGSGSYSSVMLAYNRGNGIAYAAKIINKNLLIRHRKQQYAGVEKNCLARLSAGKSSPKSPERNHQRKPSGLANVHPGVIKMHWAFQDQFSLYFVLDLAPGGELLTHIRKLGSFSYPLVKYYTAQLVDTLDYIHSLNIIHRDVKPENILLDAERRSKITDFGTAKIVDDSDTHSEGETRASSFVGSGLYVSPELLLHSQAGKSVDIWALGSIIYYMIYGDAPFKSMSEYLTFEKIKKCEYTFPDDDSPQAFHPEAKDLVEKIFVLDPAERITMKGIRAHPFLSSIEWATLWTDPAPPAEAGARKNVIPPPRAAVFGHQDDDLWDQFGMAPESDEEDEDDDRTHEDDGGPLSTEPFTSPDHDEELQRVARMYGKPEGEKLQEPDPLKPFEVPSPGAQQQVRALASVAEEPSSPTKSMRSPVPDPPKRNTGFIVISRPSTSTSGEAHPATTTAIEPDSASDGSRSPVEPAPPHHPLGLFTRVWGKSGSSTSSRRASLSAGGGLGLSVWSQAARRASFGSSSKRLSPDIGGSGPGSRRMSNNSGSAGGLSGSTRSGSNSRKGSGVFAAGREDIGRWLGMFLPGEQVLFHSAVHYRTRHGFFPAKRRVLILTDLPRLLCIKEYSSERSAAGSGGHQPGDIAVKSEILFSATTSTTRPPMLSKISEKSGEGAGHGRTPSNEHAVDEEARGDSSTEEAAVAPFRARRRSSFLGTGTVRPSIIVVKGVENKGDKMFVIRTNYKSYNYICDDANTSTQWVRELEDVRSSMHNETPAPTS